MTKEHRFLGRIIGLAGGVMLLLGVFVILLFGKPSHHAFCSVWVKEKQPEVSEQVKLCRELFPDLKSDADAK